MDDRDSQRIDAELLRLRNRYHAMAKTVSGLGYRIDELERWRNTDEPVIDTLVKERVAEEVRTAYARERSRHEWSRWQKAGAVLAGVATFAGGVTSALSALGWL